jgi:hypothetical protein
MADGTTAHYLVENRVGRLIEARVFRLVTVDEVDTYIGMIGAAVDRLPRSSTGVLCADHRPAEIYPQPVSDRLTELFRVMNARLSRVAIVTGPEKATLYMQLRRIVREAKYEARQVFQDTTPAVKHLAVELSPLELARAREFLASFPERT